MPSRNPFQPTIAFSKAGSLLLLKGLPVTGRLPVELSGRYQRNGPDRTHLADPDYHWFVGTVVHAC